MPSSDSNLSDQNGISNPLAQKYISDVDTIESIARVSTSIDPPRILSTSTVVPVGSQDSVLGLQHENQQNNHLFEQLLGRLDVTEVASPHVLSPTTPKGPQHLPPVSAVKSLLLTNNIIASPTPRSPAVADLLEELDDTKNNNNRLK